MIDVASLSERCKRDHGFEVIAGPEPGRLYLHVPTGRVDPKDGCALYYTRAMRPDEQALAERGRLDAIAAGLARDGVPGVRRRRWWKRLLG